MLKLRINQISYRELKGEKEKMREEKAFIVSVLLVGLMALGMVSAVHAAARTPNITIHIFLHPDPENSALEAGTLDLNDWPLAKEWVDRWALMPEKVTMRDYVELGMMEIDINNQKWPTGSETSKFYSDTDEQSWRSVYFRKAVACLLDRDKIVREVLKGYGYRLDVPIPPAQSAFIDMANYTASGLIYDYDVARAISFLEAGGFIDTDSDGIRNDPISGENLKELIFYIRMDDPNRRRAGEMLAAELEAVGIPVKAIVTERTVCYKNVMVLYNYHLYTGGWSLGTIPDQYHDLYSSYTYYGPDVGWSLNYPGFCNHEFDAWAKKVKYPATIEEAQEAAKVCGYLFLKYCAVVPMWSSKAVKAYKTGWTGVINNGAYGIDNYWTFLNMYKADDDTIDWGFKSDIEQLNMISSEWLWDHNVLGLIYESMLGTNPFNQAPTEFFIAKGYSVSSWDASSGGGDPDATVIRFYLRDNIYWHNISGGYRRQLNASDVKFSFDYNYECGPGISWNFPLIEELNKTVVIDDFTIDIYYNRKSAWALQWAGGMPIVNPDIWSLVPPGDARFYDPVSEDRNSNGIYDIYEDGCGAWMFENYEMGSYVSLVRDDNYYLTADFISDRLAEMFHDGAGDVDRNGVVNIRDLGFMARSLGTTTEDTHGTGWGEYNVECDFDLDGDVDVDDLAVVAVNYGKTMG